MPVSPLDFPTLSIADKVKENEIKTILSPLIINEATRNRIQSTFIEEMTLGLSQDEPERTSSLQMANTYIRDLINGTEEGTYLALDLGGTNFRVILVQLEKGIVLKEDVVYYDIPPELFLSDGHLLFDFMAVSIQRFLRDRALSHQHFNIGFTFSFPMIQSSVNVGILTMWTKSFNCPNVIGSDVIDLLNEAIKRNTDINVTVNSVLNDTTGTLVQGSYLDKRCAIGMILGTGHNGCYIEKVSNIPKWKGEHKEKEVIVDVELGAFGDNGVLDFLKTEWDHLIDNKSLLPKTFTFEKYIAGKYLGNLVREVLVTLASEGLLCRGSSSVLETPGTLHTSDITKIETEAFEGQVTYAREILSSLGLEGVTDDDAKTLQYVCGLLTYRANVLVCTLTAVLVNRMDRPHCTIAVDGSLFQLHPRFKPLMEHLITTYAPGKSFSLLLARDGSGLGAALVAAIEDRLNSQ